MPSSCCFWLIKYSFPIICHNSLHFLRCLRCDTMPSGCISLQDMKDMRTCYDSLLSAAAATANSAYGTCFYLLSLFFFIMRWKLHFSMWNLILDDRFLTLFCIACFGRSSCWAIYTCLLAWEFPQIWFIFKKTRLQFLGSFISSKHHLPSFLIYLFLMLTIISSKK